LQKKSIAIILIILLGFFAYANTLRSKFVFDDEPLVVNNVFIKSWQNFGRIFTQDVGSGSVIVKYGFYRPLQSLSFMADYSFWRLNPAGFHFTNILLHILAALSLYWLINIIFKDIFLAFLAALIFTIHPIQTEAVAYISGRSDPLAMIFISLTFILYLKQLNLKSTRLYIFMLVSFVLALLARESSLILPVLILCYHFVFKKRIILKQFLTLVVLSCAYLLIRLTFLKSLLSGISQANTLLERLPGFFVAITEYIRLLVWPFNLHMEYGIKLFRFTDPRAIFGIIVAVSLIFAALKLREKNKLISFSILWFFLSLLPVSNLYPINAYMAEHWLYLPSVGFFLVLAYGIISFGRTRNMRIARIFILLLIIFYCVITIRQNNTWKDSSVFYTRTVKFAPDSYKVLNNIGNIYKDKGQTDEAISYYKKSLNFNLNYVDAYNNLANIYLETKNYAEAISLYKKVIEINPKYAFAYNNMGNVYREMGNLTEADTLYKKALEVNPDYPDAYNNLGNVAKDQGDLAAAINYYKKALELNPDHVLANINMGNFSRALGNNKEAINLYKKALSIDPSSSIAYNNLGFIYKEIGKKEEAVVCFKKAIAINPRYALAMNNLGSTYTELGRFSEAISYFERLLELEPDNASAENNLAVCFAHEKNFALAVQHCDRALKLGAKVHPSLLKLLAPYRK